MSFYPAKGGGKTKITPLIIQSCARSYYEVGTTKNLSVYTFDKAYKSAIVFCSITKLGGEIAFTDCNYEKLECSVVGMRNSTKCSAYQLTGIKSGSKITAYSYSNQLEEGPGADPLFAVFVQE